MKVLYVILDGSPKTERNFKKKQKNRDVKRTHEEEMRLNVNVRE